MYAFSYVRISSSKQRRGSGLDRQADATLAWCQANGYTLDDSLKLEDVGSGWKQGNRDARTGLQAFLDAINTGRVPTGSVLILENLDRLSREEIDEALSLFLDIIRSGVSIKTHDPDRLYTRADIKQNPHVLMEPLIIFARANEESRTKSYRLRDAWVRRRKDSSDGKRRAHGQLPGWLRYAEDGSIEPDPEKTATVKRIFQLAAEGLGQPQITRILNHDGVPTLGKAKSWNSTYIYELFRNRAVLGEMQPKVKVGNRRVPEGEPIPGYYPAVIDEATFALVRSTITTRKVMRKVGNPEGREARRRKRALAARGDRHNRINLFREILFSANDGSALHVHYSSNKPDRHLRSWAAIHGNPGACSATFKYDVLEGAFLRHVVELKASDFLNNAPAPPDESEALSSRLAVLAHKIEVVQQRIDTADNIEPLLDTLQRLQAQRAEVKERLGEVKRRRITAESDNLGEVKGLIALLDETPDDEKEILLVKIRSRIRSLVKAIHVKVGDLDDNKVRAAVVQVRYHDDTLRYFFCGYSRTKKKLDLYEDWKTDRRPEGDWIATF